MSKNTGKATPVVVILYGHSFVKARGFEGRVAAHAGLHSKDGEYVLNTPLRHISRSIKML